MKRGKFIVIEGGEGAGKGVCMSFLKEQLVCRDDIIFTREPGGTLMAEKIRELVLSKGNEEMLPLTELFLFCGARAQHVNELIKSALESGKNVICDRFEASTFAYQIFGRQRPEYIEVFNQLNNIAKAGLELDAVIYLDVEPEVGLERKAKSKDGHCTRFDEEKLEFHKRVREGFLTQFKQAVDKEIKTRKIGKKNIRWVLIPTTEMSEKKEKDKVLEIVQEILEK